MTSLGEAAVITITAYQWVPPFVQGLARDLRLRWALEEAGLPYKTAFIALGEQGAPDYKARHPFGQIPLFEDSDLVMFESGAIVLHIGERSEALLPRDTAGKARATMWVFAALNTMEAALQRYVELDLFYPGQEWTAHYKPIAEKSARKRLSELAAYLGGRDYLEDRFTAGDLMMVAVLRILRATTLLETEPALKAYQARCEARPAFQRALADHMADNEKPAAAP